MSTNLVPRLKARYVNEIRSALVSEFGLRNALEAPRLEKVVLNMGVGDAVGDSKRLRAAIEDLSLIAGQRPVRTLAKKSIASFKIREGQGIGAKVTLRGSRMYEFIDRLITIALPRVRDFRGLSPRAFDGNGNYALGIREQVVFPEINYDKVERIRGLDVVVCTSAASDKEALALLKHFNFPFQQSRA